MSRIFILWAMEQSTGTTIKVSRAANSRPKMTATATDLHDWEESAPISRANFSEIKAEAGSHGQKPKNGSDGGPHHHH
ncbi:MAG: hypothetical protein OES64_13290 [Desulfobacteraceae bacterium]|nr:hypothetical protein [Desulfobacteraceae bacterium]